MLLRSPRTSARTTYARTPSGAVAWPSASVVITCSAFGAGERASASAAKYPNVGSAMIAGAASAVAAAGSGERPSARIDADARSSAIGMVDAHEPRAAS